MQQALDNVLLDVRSNPNDVTGESPFFRMFCREMNSKLSLLSISGDDRVVGRSRDLVKEYALRKSVVKDFKPGETVLLRKSRKEPYKHCGKFLRKVGRFTYEVEMNGRSCVFNQANMKLCVGTVDFDLNDRLDEAYEDAAQREPVAIAPPVVPVPKSVPVPLRRSARQRQAPNRLTYQ